MNLFKKTEPLPGVTVVIPAYNEENAIAATLANLKKSLEGVARPTEILVVDDGSSDRTADVAAGAGVRVIRHPANNGYGRSLLTGIEAAEHDVIAIVDADGTYPVERLPDLLAFFDRGFDMAVGARQGKHFQGSFSKRILRTIFRFLAEFTSGRAIPDINSGFRVFRRAPVLADRTALSTGFSFTTTITLLFALNHLFLGYMPVEYHARIGQSKVRLLPDALRSLQIVLTAIAQFNPLKLYLLLMLKYVGGLLLILLLYALGMPPAFAWLLVICWCTLSLIAACAVLAVVMIRPRRAQVAHGK